MRNGWHWDEIYRNIAHVQYMENSFNSKRFSIVKEGGEVEEHQATGPLL